MRFFYTQYLIICQYNRKKTYVFQKGKKILSIVKNHTHTSMRFRYTESICSVVKDDFKITMINVLKIMEKHIVGIIKRC